MLKKYNCLQTKPISSLFATCTHRILFSAISTVCESMSVQMIIKILCIQLSVLKH